MGERTREGIVGRRAARFCSLGTKFGDKGNNMKLTNFISYAAASMMAVAPIAAAQAQSADFMVVRDGKVVSAAGPLVSGDRVVTRGSSGATVALAGCSMNVPAASTVVVNTNSCSDAVASLDVNRAGYVAGQDASALNGSGWIVALLALLAVIAGIIAAASGNSNPTSP